MKFHPKRYSLVRIIPCIPIPKIISELRKNIFHLAGARGLANSGVHIVHSEVKDGLYIILRSTLDDLQLVQSAILMLENCFVEVVKVSGTVKKLRKEISEKDF